MSDFTQRGNNPYYQHQAPTQLIHVYALINSPRNERKFCTALFTLLLIILGPLQSYHKLVYTLSFSSSQSHLQQLVWTRRGCCQTNLRINHLLAVTNCNCSVKWQTPNMYFLHWSSSKLFKKCVTSLTICSTLQILWRDVNLLQTLTGNHYFLQVHHCFQFSNIFSQSQSIVTVE